jgi:hypothetical protein
MKVSLDSCLRRNDNGDDNEGVDRRLDTGLRGMDTRREGYVFD